jgi:hypothetical protein
MPQKIIVFMIIAVRISQLDAETDRNVHKESLELRHEPPLNGQKTEVGLASSPTL